MRPDETTPAGSGVVLACDTCQHTWEPDEDAFDTAATGCPWCAGWTWVAELADPPSMSNAGSTTRGCQR